jgi:hypothetical protein
LNQTIRSGKAGSSCSIYVILEAHQFAYKTYRPRCYCKEMMINGFLSFPFILPLWYLKTFLMQTLP